MFLVFFKQKTAYDMLISDWRSDVCSSDLQSALPSRVWMLIAPIQSGSGQHRPEAISNDLNRGLISCRAVQSRGKTSTTTLPTSGALRTAERRDGKECVSTCRTR